SVLPLAILLYVEALLRRHLALGIKLLVLGGTVFFAVLSVAGRLDADPLWLPVFTVYVFVLQLVLGAAIVFRDRGDLTPVEDRSVGAIAVAVLFIVPFVATDLATDIGLYMVRVGSVGILMFVHA